MSSIDLGEDDGYISVKVAGVEVTLDLWETNSRIYDYSTAAKDRPDADYNRGLVDLLESMGLPRLSFGMAAKFVRAINAAAAEKKEPASITAVSPASTASTPGP